MSDIEPWFLVSTQTPPRPLFSGRGHTPQRSWLSDLKELEEGRLVSPPLVSPPLVSSPLVSSPLASSPPASSPPVSSLHGEVPSAPPPAISPAATAAFTAAAARLDVLREQLLETARQEMVELALQIARSIVGEHVSRADVDIQPLLENALSQIAEGIQATVRVHPTCRHMVEAWMVHVPGRTVRIVVDPSLQAGDVVVESDGGGVDGRLDTRLARAEEGVRRALGVDGGPVRSQPR